MGRIWSSRRCRGRSECLDGDVGVGGISGNPTWTGSNSGRKVAYSRSAYVVFLRPPSSPSSVSIRHLPPASVLGRLWLSRRCRDWSVCPDDDVGGGGSENRRGTVQISGEKRPILERLMSFSASAIARLLPSDSASFRTGSLLGIASVSATCPGGPGDLSVFRKSNHLGFRISLSSPDASPPAPFPPIHE